MVENECEFGARRLFVNKCQCLSVCYRLKGLFCLSLCFRESGKRRDGGEKSDCP